MKKSQIKVGNTYAFSSDKAGLESGRNAVPRIVLVYGKYTLVTQECGVETLEYTGAVHHYLLLNDPAEGKNS